MDDSVANNLFNNPITGGDKNDDFLASEVAIPPVTETGKSQNERLAGGHEDGSVHREKTAEKAEQVAGRRNNVTVDQTTAHAARELISKRGELADVTNADEVGERAEREIRGAKRAGRIVEELGKFTKKFRELGGERFVKNVLPVVGLLSIAALSIYLQHAGNGMSELVATNIPEAWKGMVAVGNEENRLLEGAIKKRGGETENKKWLPVAERSLGAAAGLVAGQIAGESASTFPAYDMVIHTARGAEHLLHKLIESPILNAKQRAKEKREVTPLNPASIEAQKKSHLIARRVRRKAERNIESTSPETPLPPPGPGRYRAKRKERRSEMFKQKKHERKAASLASSSEPA
jgi:hypothetical protein